MLDVRAGRRRPARTVFYEADTKSVSGVGTAARARSVAWTVTMTALRTGRLLRPLSLGGACRLVCTRSALARGGVRMSGAVAFRTM